MRTICFDLDGTLTDPVTGITRSIRYALTELTGAAPDAEELTWCIGPPLLGSFEKLLGDKDDALTALAKYRERFGDVGLFENEVYRGIPETLAALTASGCRLLVATSKPVVYARRIVDHFGLSKYFDDVFGSELDGTRADKTELLAWVCDRKRLRPAEAAMVGDRSHDMVGARNNGLRAVGVLYGFGSHEELIGAGAEVTCHTPGELLDVLG